MPFTQDETKALEHWLVPRLVSLTTAEPVIVAQFITAVIEPLDSVDEMKNALLPELQPFLAEETPGFVDRLIHTIRSKSFLRGNDQSRVHRSRSRSRSPRNRRRSRSRDRYEPSSYHSRDHSHRKHDRENYRDRSTRHASSDRSRRDRLPKDLHFERASRTGEERAPLPSNGRMLAPTFHPNMMHQVPPRGMMPRFPAPMPGYSRPQLPIRRMNDTELSTDETESSTDNTTNGAKDPQRRTLYVHHIPAQLCNLAPLSSYFGRFGLVTNITLRAMKGEAFVQFCDRQSAERAYRSRAPVCNNPHIRTQWARKEWDVNKSQKRAPENKNVHSSNRKMDTKEQVKSEKPQKPNVSVYDRQRQFLEKQEIARAQLKQMIEEQRKLLQHLKENGSTMGAEEKSKLIKSAKQAAEEIKQKQTNIDNALQTTKRAAESLLSKHSSGSHVSGSSYKRSTTQDNSDVASFVSRVKERLTNEVTNNDEKDMTENNNHQPSREGNASGEVEEVSEFSQADEKTLNVSNQVEEFSRLRHTSAHASRGRGRGRGRGGRGRGRGGYIPTRTIDNRPTTLHVTLPRVDESERSDIYEHVIEALHTYGAASIVDKNMKNMVIDLHDRRSAERAYRDGITVAGEKLQMQWYRETPESKDGKTNSSQSETIHNKSANDEEK